MVLEAELKQQKHEINVTEGWNEQLRTHLLDFEPCHTLAIDHDEKNADWRQVIRIDELMIQ